MTSPPVSELTERARAIFRLVVEGYLDSGVPVGSKTLAEGGVSLSPASIRSVLSELEMLGLLAAPHTSAGRLPTEMGLRLFVDGMMQVAEPSAEERAAIERRLGNPGPIEAALEATSTVLSEISGAAGMVMVPRREPRLAQMSIVGLDAARALVVLAGRTLGEAGRAMQAEIASGRSALDSASRDLVERGLAVLSEDAARRPVLIVRGQANLLDEAALHDIERVRSLIDDLESKQSVAELLDSAREAEATRIFIGSENRLFALSGSSVIAAPYRDREGRVVGVLGVIGPTRLNYARVVPMVDFTARSLGKRIG